MSDPKFHTTSMYVEANRAEERATSPSRYVRRSRPIRHFYTSAMSLSIRHSRESGNPSSLRLTRIHFRTLSSKAPSRDTFVVKV